jgi:L-iditol 2-dehydrogenase
MKQAYVPEPEKILYREVERPGLDPHEVLLRVAKIGICGSDIHVFKGKHPLVSFPLVQGHEFSGYIEEIGRDVTGFAKGELVTVEPAIGCGTCRKCKAGFFAQCDELLFIGGALTGAGSEYFAVDAHYAVKMPQNATPDDAAMVEPLAVAVHSVHKIPDIQGRNVLIIGGGTIGNLTAQVAKIYGAGPIILVDKIPFRNTLARKIGCVTLEPTADLDKQVRDILKGEQPEIAFECVGSAAPLNTCIQLVERGGSIIVIGVYEDAPQTEMVLVQDKELHMIGSLMYTWDDYREAVDLIGKKQVDLKLLQTHHFPFEQWGEAYTLLMEHPEQAVKVLIDVDEGIQSS